VKNIGLLENITENLLDQETSFSKMGVRRDTKLLQLLPCKEKVAHALKEHDRVARRHFCICFIQVQRDGEADPQLVLFCDVARF
jgi:hypothetical protein